MQKSHDHLFITSSQPSKQEQRLPETGSTSVSKSQPPTSPVLTTVPAKDQHPFIDNSRVNVSGWTGNFFTMSSTIKLEKIKGDGSQDVNAWLVNFSQWANFHNLPHNKILDAFPFYLESNGKIWYDVLPNEIKSHPDTIEELFQERLKELDNFFGSFCER